MVYEPMMSPSSIESIPSPDIDLECVMTPPKKLKVRGRSPAPKKTSDLMLKQIASRPRELLSNFAFSPTNVY